MFLQTMWGMIGTPLRKAGERGMDWEAHNWKPCPPVSPLFCASPYIHLGVCAKLGMCVQGHQGDNVPPRPHRDGGERAGAFPVRLPRPTDRGGGPGQGEAAAEPPKGGHPGADSRLPWFGHLLDRTAPSPPARCGSMSSAATQCCRFLCHLLCINLLTGGGARTVIG